MKILKTHSALAAVTALSLLAPRLARADYQSTVLADGPKAYYRLNDDTSRTLINKNSPHRESALKFLVYMASESYNTCINDQADALAPVKRFCVGPAYEKNPAFPEESLLVLKSLGKVPHGGQQRFAEGSRYHRILTDWIAADRDI